MNSRTLSTRRVSFSEYIHSINVDRDPGFYLYKIVVPLLITVAFNWATYWMPGEPITPEPCPAG